MGTCRSTSLMIGTLFFFTVPQPSAYAEVAAPVWIIDEFVSNEGQVQFDGNLSYVSSSSKSAKGYHGGYLSLTPTHVIPVLSNVDDVHQQADRFIAMLGVRYGLTDATEIGLRATGAWTQTRSYASASTTSSTVQDLTFNSISINGASRLYQGAQSSVFAFTSIGLLDRVSLRPYRPKNVNFHTFTIGVGGYVVDDPVVFSLTGSATLSRDVQFADGSYRRGSFFSLAPGISFLANDRTTLSSGLEFSYQLADRFDGRKLHLDRSQTRLSLGVGYAFNEKLTVHGNYWTSMAGLAPDSTAQISFTYKN